MPLQGLRNLIAVRYRIFEGEDSAIVAAHSGRAHDFSGELVLVFEAASMNYVSWTSEPVQYAIGSSKTSHFLPDAPLVEHDVSGSTMWRGLVGKEVSAIYVGTDNQIMRISSADDHVLVCSFERGHWFADEVTICKQVPSTDLDQRQAR